jgi:hypothetical protein
LGDRHGPARIPGRRTTERSAQPRLIAPLGCIKGQAGGTSAWINGILPKEKNLIKISNLIVPLAALFVLGSATIAAALPIDSGYNNGIFAPYPTPPLTPNTSSQLDNYWINIASYPTVPVSPSYVLNHSWGPFVAPIANSRWIGPRNKAASATGTTPSNPSYSIFRKCFCLEPGFNTASLSFSLMNDNSAEVWLNTVTNVLFGPAVGSSTSPVAVTANASQLGLLHAGTNCMYVLLEDTGGAMGFDLAGSFNAIGLDPYAAYGVDQTFPCPCNRKPGPTKAMAEDQQAVSAIVKIAESRRKASQK